MKKIKLYLDKFMNRTHDMKSVVTTMYYIFFLVCFNYNILKQQYTYILDRENDIMHKGA